MLLNRDWLNRFLRSKKPLLHELSDLKMIIELCSLCAYQQLTESRQRNAQVQTYTNFHIVKILQATERGGSVVRRGTRIREVTGSNPGADPNLTEVFPWFSSVN